MFQSRKAFSTMESEESDASVFWNSTFEKSYKPVVLGVGRLFGLNTYVADKNCNYRFLKCLLIVNRLVSVLALLSMLYRLADLTIYNDQKIGLNAATVYLIQIYSTDFLAVINHVALFFLQKPLVKLAKDINDLNPYKVINGIKRVNIISSTTAILFILSGLINGTMYGLAAQGLVRTVIPWRSALRYATPLATPYVLAAVAYPFLMLAVITRITSSICKNFNADLHKLVDNFAKFSNVAELQSELSDIQMKFNCIVKIVKKMNNLFSHLCTLDFIYTMFMLCITSSILYKANDIEIQDNISFIIYLLELEMTMIIVAVPGIVLFLEVSLSCVTCTIACTIFQFQGQKPVDPLCELLTKCNVTFRNEQSKLHEVRFL